MSQGKFRLRLAFAIQVIQSHAILDKIVTEYAFKAQTMITLGHGLVVRRQLLERNGLKGIS